MLAIPSRVSQDNIPSDVVYLDFIKSKNKKRKFKKRLHEPQDTIPRQPISIDAADTDSCIALWQGVVLQAFYDLANSSGADDIKLIRAESASWFAQYQEDSDFSTVCTLANLNKKKILSISQKIIKKNKDALSGLNCRSIRKNYSNRAFNRKPKIGGKI